ncbi:hypothetical protein [Leptospira andrefontaineae]|uniref:LRAT domain-containing protein n=1 Tax=Leptospira andrefontaineae TaxID=2484976 RepID=A0A4R9H959_9LEPT|nr:hypothetical protein [Leptospira andrefontaineae]TGK42468.1 hypothetical protein EHO65_06865 [Leptospira andrefontaineae]
MNQIELTKGLYLAKKPAKEYFNLVDHYGVIDIGNVSGLFHNAGQSPIVIEKIAGKGNVANYASSDWIIIGKVKDHHILSAKIRLKTALNDPTYDLLGNNCEHFARFITEGKKRSTQVNVFAMAAMAGLVFLMSQD